MSEHPDVSLDTLSRLNDVRLRVFNRERVSPEEMRLLILDIVRDRENASRAGAKSRAAAKKAASAPTPLNLADLFGAGGSSK
jgi:hypothetical protein